MKNMSPVPFGKTEDDTYEALRRIPQSQVREKLDEFGLYFDEYRESYYSNTAYNKRMKFWNPIKRFFGFSTYHKSIDSNMFLQEIEVKLAGTGWTVESYAADVDVPILEKRAEIHAIKVKRRIYVLCAALCMFAAGIALAISLGVVWTQGLYVGAQLLNCITITYHWIVDKHWPYPSYHYRYE